MNEVTSSSAKLITNIYANLSHVNFQLNTKETCKTPLPTNISFIKRRGATSHKPQ